MAVRLTSEAKNYLRLWTGRFRNDLMPAFEQKLREQVQPYEAPAEIQDLGTQSHRLLTAIDSGPDEVTIADDLVPVLKLIVLTLRRNSANEIDIPRTRTFHPDLLGRLE